MNLSVMSKRARFQCDNTMIIGRVVHGQELCSVPLHLAFDRTSLL